MAVGEQALWAPADGRLFRANPATDEVTAPVSLGDPSSHLAVYGGAVWAMAHVEEFRLARVAPGTVRIVPAEDFGSIPNVGAGGRTAGGGYVRFSSGKGLARVAP